MDIAKYICTMYTIVRGHSGQTGCRKKILFIFYQRLKMDQEDRGNFLLYYFISPEKITQIFILKVKPMMEFINDEH